MVMLVPHSPLEQPKPQAAGEAWQILAEDCRREVKSSGESVVAARSLAPVQMSRFQDEHRQKDRLEHLSLRLKNVFFVGNGREEEVDASSVGFHDLFCQGGTYDSGVLRSMVGKLGLDCEPSKEQNKLQKFRIKNLQRRRSAASSLIDELESEVLGLNELMMSEQAGVAFGALPFPKTNGGPGALPVSPDDKACCLEELACNPLCSDESHSRPGEVGPQWSRGPELRCELREQLRRTQHELMEAKQELEAARQMGSTAWESVKQVLKDTNPEASLLDGRRSLLAFARGKARGTMIAEKLLHWDLRRKLLQTVLLGWMQSVRSLSHAKQMQAVFFRSWADASGTVVLQAVFSAWRHISLQSWSGKAEQRLRRHEDILVRLSARMLAGDGHALQHFLFSQWRVWTKISKMPSYAQRSPEKDGKEDTEKVTPPAAAKPPAPQKGCCQKCACSMM